MKNNDILFSNINSLEHIGKVAFVQHLSLDVIHGMNLLNIRVNEKSISSKFIYYQLLIMKYNNLFKKIAKPAVNQASIAISELKKLVIKVPAVNEQCKIQALLTCLEKIITLYERKLKLLSQVKKYFLDNLFTEKEYPNLRFKGFTDAWEQRKLGDISEKRIEKNNSLSIDNILSNSAIYGIVKQNQYFDKTIANNIQNYYIVHTNDFIYNPHISNNAPFGPISRNKLAESGVMSPLYLVFYFSKKSLSDFFEIYFKSSKWHNFMYMHGNSGARSDRFAIKDNEFFKMRVKIPHNKSEIDKIYRLNILLNSLITLYESKKQNLNKIKNTLLNTMFI